MDPFTGRSTLAHLAVEAAWDLRFVAVLCWLSVRLIPGAVEYLVAILTLPLSLPWVGTVLSALMRAFDSTPEPSLPFGVWYTVSYIIYWVDAWVLVWFLQLAAPILAWYASVQFGSVALPRSDRLRHDLVNSRFDPDVNRPSSNAHYAAAARRAAARRHILSLVSSRGMEPYMIALSNQDLRDGILGSRTLVSNKDAISYLDLVADGRPSDPVPPNAAFIMIDVDFHLSADQMAELVSLGRPIYMYTFAPKSVCYKTDGINVEYVGNGLWTTEVPNNPYTHKFWDWNNEHRYFRPREWFSIFFKVGMILAALWCLYTIHQSVLSAYPLEPGVHESRSVHWTRSPTGCYTKHPGWSFPVPDVRRAEWVEAFLVTPEHLFEANIALTGKELDPAFLNVSVVPLLQLNSWACANRPSPFQGISHAVQELWDVNTTYKPGKCISLSGEYLTLREVLDWVAFPQNWLMEVLSTTPTYRWSEPQFGGIEFFAQPAQCRSLGFVVTEGEARAAAALRWSAMRFLGIAVVAFTLYLVTARNGHLVRIVSTTAGTGREIVAIIPARVLTPWQDLCYTASGHFDAPLTPLVPTEVKYGKDTDLQTYAALQVIGVDQRYTSIMRLGSHVSYEITPREYEALLAGIHALGKRPSGTSAQGTLTRHKPADGKTYTAEEAIQLTNCVAALNGIDPVGVSYECRDGAGITRYQMGAPLSLDDEQKMSDRPYMHWVFGGGGNMPVKSKVNTAAGIEIRVKRPENVAMPSDRDLALGEEFLTHCKKELKMAEGQDGYAVSCFSAELVLERQPRPTQRALLAEAVHFSNPLALMYGFSSSVKPHEVTSKPRMITVPVGADYKLYSSFLGYRTADAMKNHSWFVSGLNYFQTGERVRDTFDATGATVEGELDFSNMDGSHGFYEFQLFSRYVYYVTPFEDHEHVEAILQGTFWTTVRSDSGKYDIKSALGSGLWLTTLYNSFTGALMSYRARRLLVKGEAPEESYRRVGLHSGDDSILVDPPEKDLMTACYRELGFSVKLDTFERGSRRVSFLARIYDTRDGSSVADAMRILKKVHISSLPAELGDANIAALKWTAVALSDFNTPILGAMARKILAAVSPKMLELVTNVHAGDAESHERLFDSVHAALQGQSAPTAMGYLPYQSLLDRAIPIAATDWADDYIEAVMQPEWIRQIADWCADDSAPWNAPPTVHVFDPLVSPGITGASANGETMPVDPVASAVPPSAQLDADRLAAFRAAASKKGKEAAREPLRGGSPAVAADARRDDDGAEGPALPTATPVEPANASAPAVVAVAITPSPASSAPTDQSLTSPPKRDRTEAHARSQLDVLRAHRLYKEKESQSKRQNWGAPGPKGITAERWARVARYGPLEDARFRSPDAKEKLDRYPWSAEERAAAEAAIATQDGRREYALLMNVARVGFHDHPTKKRTDAQQTAPPAGGAPAPSL